MIFKNVLFPLFFFFSIQLSAQTLLTNLHQGIDSTQSADPDEITVFKGKLYFVAENPQNGRELWVSDGTVAGTQILKDINQGIGSSDPGELTVADDWLYFAADDGVHEHTLWKTDGTPEGTAMVIDLKVHFNIYDRGIVYDGYCNTYFIGDGLLWRTDGTKEGTVLLSSTHQGDLIEPRSLILVGNQLFFKGSTPSTGLELYVSDGIDSSNTHLVREMTPGYMTGFPTILSTNYWVAADSLLFFIAYDTANYAIVIHRSNGTYAGTYPIHRNNPALGYYHPEDMIFHQSKIYFSGWGATHRELYMIDVPTETVSLLKDINTNPSSSSNPKEFFIWKDTVHFAASKNFSRKLWKTDGTMAGTQVAIDSIELFGIDLNFVIDDNHHLYFKTQDDPVNGIELWKSDGTTAGTYMVKDINSIYSSEPENLVMYNNEVYFRARTADDDKELWKSDGTDAGTIILKHINNGNYSSHPDQFTGLNQQVVFVADSDTIGRELYTFNKITGAVTLLKDINSGIGSSNPEHLFHYGNYILFAANDGMNGIELWRTDGTANGTVMIKDINLTIANNSSEPYGFVKMNNGYVYFVATDGTGAGTNKGLNIWRTDGTTVGTTEIITNDRNSIPELIVHNNTLYFSVISTLFKSDGTEAGTFVVTNQASFAGFFHLIGKENDIYFKGFQIYPSQNIDTGWELGVTGGTTATTKIVADIYPGDNSSIEFYENPKYTLLQDTSLLFLANDGVHGYELWRTDRDKNIAYLFKDLNPGAADGWSGLDSNEEDIFLTLGDEVFFYGNDGIHGVELWKTDGTDSGTVMIKDINPGKANSKISYMTKVKNVIYFTAYTAEHGAELWRTDGTTYGTFLAADINAGHFSSNPAHLSNINDTLYFSADDGINGVEAWEYVPSCESYMDYNLTLCQGDTAFINNNIYLAEGEYFDTLTNYLSCDSLIKINITIIQPFDTATVYICSGETYTFNNKVYTTPGFYVDTVGNCHAPYHFNLITLKDTTYISTTSCFGQNFTMGDHTFYYPGQYSLCFKNQMGCDSLVFVDFIISNDLTTLNETICTGDSVVIGNQSFMQSGNYTIGLQNILGCDSTIQLNLSVISPLQSNFSDTICFGDQYQFGTQAISASGTYHEVYQSVDGCDSTVTLTLMELSEIILTDTSLVYDDSTGNGAIDVTINGGIPPYQYLWSNAATSEDLQNLTSGTYTVTVTDNFGCQTSTTFDIFYVATTLLPNAPLTASIFPNPIQTNERLTLQLNSQENIKATLVIYDVLGRALLSPTSIDIPIGQSAHPIDVPLSNGLFLIKLQSNSTVLKTFKVIVQE